MNLFYIVETVITMTDNNWTVQNEISKRVNKESDWDWGKTPQPIIPEYIKPTIERDKPGWINFINLIKELKV